MKLFMMMGLAILVGIGIQQSQAQALVNASYANSTLPIFDQKCKQELKIPQDQPLGLGFTRCMNTLKMLANHTLTSSK